MIYQIRQYIKFLLKSSNQHGVHSPFVYNLVTKCFYDKTKFSEYSRIDDYRKVLLKDKTTFQDTAFGVNAQISQFAKHINLSNSETKLLFRLVNYLDCKSILELGTSLGVATHAMALGNLTGHITTIEQCPNLSQFTSSNFQQQHLQNIDSLNSPISEVIPTLSKATYDLVFFNIKDQKESILHYFETLIPRAHNDTIFIFNGINSSKSKTNAWETIKQHPNVTVSINTFNLGFIFFRTEQNKEHFTIRL